MSQIHVGQRVEAPIDHIWELAIDPKRLPEYNPYMVLTHLTGGLDQVGTTMDSSMRLLHMTVQAKVTIAEVEPKRLIHIHAESESHGPSEWIYRFEPIGDLTQVSLDIEYDPKGVVGEVLDRVVFERALERAARHILENFAALATARVPLPA